MAKKRIGDLESGLPVGDQVDIQPATFGESDIDSGAGDNGSGDTDHGNGSDSAGSEPVKPRKPRAPYGSRKAKGSIGLNEKTREKAVAGFAKLLVKVHSYAEAINPIWAMDMAEAMDLSEALQDVADAYKVKYDPRVAATLNLLAAIGTTYGGRIIAIKMMRDFNAKHAEHGAFVDVVRRTNDSQSSGV